MKTPEFLIAGYFVTAVICFGPATVEAEQAQARYLRECQTLYTTDLQRLHTCRLGSPAPSIEGTLKALFWPAWISYTLAK